MVLWTLFTALVGGLIAAFCCWLLCNPDTYHRASDRRLERDEWFLARCHMLVRRDNLKLFVVCLLWAAFIVLILAFITGMHPPLLVTHCAESVHRTCTP